MNSRCMSFVIASSVAFLATGIATSQTGESEPFPRELIGTWSVTSIESDEGKVSASHIGKITISIIQKKWIATIELGQAKDSISLRADHVIEVNCKQIHLLDDQSTALTGISIDIRYLYSIHDDELRLCGCEDGSLPEAFPAKRKRGQTMISLKRKGSE